MAREQHGVVLCFPAIPRTPTARTCAPHWRCACRSRAHAPGGISRAEQSSRLLEDDADLRLLAGCYPPLHCLGRTNSLADMSPVATKGGRCCLKQQSLRRAQAYAILAPRCDGAFSRVVVGRHIDARVTHQKWTRSAVCHASVALFSTRMVYAISRIRTMGASQRTRRNCVYILASRSPSLGGRRSLTPQLTYGGLRATLPRGLHAQANSSPHRSQRHGLSNGQHHISATRTR